MLDPKEKKKLATQSSVAAGAVVTLINKLPIATFAKFVGILSAASSVGVSWIEAVEDVEDRRKMGVALASRLLDVGDIFIGVGNGMDMKEAMAHAAQPDTSASALADSSAEPGEAMVERSGDDTDNL